MIHFSVLKEILSIFDKTIARAVCVICVLNILIYNSNPINLKKFIYVFIYFCVISLVKSCQVE